MWRRNKIIIIKNRWKGVIMKQRITAEDLQQLTDEQKQRLRIWWKPHAFDIFYDSGEKKRRVLLDAEMRGGSMVLFYGDRRVDYVIYHIDGDLNRNLLPLLNIGQMIELLHDRGGMKPFDLYDYVADDICDALWEAVKEVL